MVVRGTRLDTAQMASLVVTVVSQINKRSIGSEGLNINEFVEVSQHKNYTITFSHLTSRQFQRLNVNHNRTFNK